MELIRTKLNESLPDFWHTAEWLNYCKQSSFTEGEDYSVEIRKGANRIGFIPLIKEGYDFTFQRSFGPEVILTERRELGAVADMLKDYARRCGVRRIAIEGFMPGYIHHARGICAANPASPYIRKSYRSLINRADKELTAEIVNNSTASEVYVSAIIDMIRELYFEIAGKQTRPSVTFEYYKRWINMGYMSLLIAYRRDEVAGFTLVTHYLENSYYFMCGVVPEFKGYDVSHFLQSVALKMLKKKGQTRYVLGGIERNSLLSCPTKKESDISFFKSGFGEAEYTVLSECFLDEDYFREKFSMRIDNYIGAEFDEENDILPEARAT